MEDNDKMKTGGPDASAKQADSRETLSEQAVGRQPQPQPQSQPRETDPSAGRELRGVDPAAGGDGNRGGAASDPGAENKNGSPGALQQQVRLPLWVEILAFVGVYMAASFIGALVKGILQKAGGADAEFSMFVSYVISMGLTLIYALWRFAKRNEGKLRLRFSLKKANPALILWGILLVVMTSVVLEPLLALFDDSYLRLLENAIGTGFWAILMTVIAAPLLEEMVFRGVLQESLTKEMGAVKGVLLAAAIFGIIHIIPQQVINAFFIGIILGYIYIKTESLVPVIVIHAVNNALAYIIMYLFGAEAAVNTRAIIGNDVIYWVIYIICALILVVALLNLWGQIRKIEREGVR